MGDERGMAHFISLRTCTSFAAKIAVEDLPERNANGIGNLIQRVYTRMLVVEIFQPQA
ncbi:hypothetical protein EPYR_00462 [Erwinia pyrifoliae DSM 12163]|nr:hypothetical protein EPYR_00462 [Erwinia pyrifoliae DSM 12163]